MSRQYDDSVADEFEANGEVYSLVDPSSLEELVEAEKIRNILVHGFGHEDEQYSMELLGRQEEYIRGFIENLDDFDKSTLIKNISFLCKKYHISIGFLEQILGISAGYISRTKSDSGKKLSVDVVWKISKLFGVDIRTLLTTELAAPNNNAQLLSKFLDKLREQTECNEITWEICGGTCTCISDSFIELGIAYDDGTKGYYRPLEEYRKSPCPLDGDIYTCSQIDKNKLFAVIPFKIEEGGDTHYDFMFLWCDNDKKYHCEKAFYSWDDRFGEVEEYAGLLYDQIETQAFDVQMTTEVRNTIVNYLM